MDRAREDDSLDAMAECRSDMFFAPTIQDSGILSKRSTAPTAPKWMMAPAGISLPRSSALYIMAAGLGFAAVMLLVPPAFATVAGVVRLAADESRQLSLDPPDRWIRVCSDMSSAGTDTVTIGEQKSRILPPGWCAENRADSLVIKNGHAGPALVTYESVFSNTFQN